MATITGRVTRLTGKDISTDELSDTYKGVRYVPYKIDVLNRASLLRGILLVSQEAINDYGDPDGEALVLTLT